MDERAIEFGLAAVMTDARFVVRYGHQAQSLPDLSSTLMLTSGAWISMIAHEGARVLADHAPQLLHGSPSDVAATIARARHGLKLFEDRARSIDEYQAYFEEIALQHREFFIDPVARPLRFLASDLGLTTIDSRLVLTSHGVSFGLGLPPSVVNDPSFTSQLQALSYEWGAYVALAGLATEGPPLAALTAVANLRTDRVLDRKSQRVYARSFNGPTTPYLNAVLLYFEALCNSTTWLVPRSPGADDSERFTVFKIRFVVAVHLLNSLRRLVDHDSLTPLLKRAIEDELAAPAFAFQERRARSLRNLLVHYVPARSFDFERASAVPLLDGAVAGVGYEQNADDLASAVDQTLTSLAHAFGRWRNVRL
jgi:hypothetical protein